MAVPIDTSHVMTPAEFRWELRLQPTQPVDAVLTGGIRRAIAWITENTGLPVLPKHEMYQLGYVERHVGIAQDLRGFTIGIPNVVYVTGIIVDGQELPIDDFMTEVFEGHLLCVTRKDQAAFLARDSIVRISVWRGIHIGTDDMENIRSLVAAIGREIFDGLDFRKNIKTTLAMSSIVDRLALHQRPLLGALKVEGILDEAVALPQDLRPIDNPSIPETPLDPSTPHEFQVSYGLADDAGLPVGAAVMESVQGLQTDVRFPATTAEGPRWYITLPDGYTVRQVLNVSVGASDVTTSWTMARTANRWYYSGDVFGEGIQYHARFMLGALL